MRLTSDEKAMLNDLFSEPGYPILVKVLYQLSESLDERSFKVCLDGSPDKERALVYAKCEAEGARKIVNTLRTEMKAIRVATSEAKGEKQH